jgi:hypothetical protein
VIGHADRASPLDDDGPSRKQPPVNLIRSRHQVLRDHPRLDALHIARLRCESTLRQLRGAACLEQASRLVPATTSPEPTVASHGVALASITTRAIGRSDHGVSVSARRGPGVQRDWLAPPHRAIWRSSTLPSFGSRHRCRDSFAAMMSASGQNRLCAPASYSG